MAQLTMDLLGVDDGSAVEWNPDERPEEGPSKLDDLAGAVEEMIRIILSFLTERARSVRLKVPDSFDRKLNGLPTSRRGKSIENDEELVLPNFRRHPDGQRSVV